MPLSNKVLFTCFIPQDWETYVFEYCPETYEESLSNTLKDMPLSNKVLFTCFIPQDWETYVFEYCPETYEESLSNTLKDMPLSNKVLFNCFIPQDWETYVFEYCPETYERNQSDMFDSKLKELMTYRGESDFDGGFTWNQSRLVSMLSSSWQWNRYLESGNVACTLK
ncbi:hypothetical protein CRE_01232 [Caenorhabditis remanei]|uniref:Uncharacterized protein n=1 Tax=Caenorhabditis remanei TaxID=31234 RepID=E3N4Q6_CAERE|nr:hypothetical protein CRE_01232 [Caenorhabditis remanei]